MKYFAMLLLLLGSFIQAQDVEEMQDSSGFYESTRAFSHVEVVKPFDYYLVNSCQNQPQFSRAQYSGGDAALAQELQKNLLLYVDREMYAPNGPFYLQISINTEGMVTAVSAFPKVKNSAAFLEDLRKAFLNTPQRWTPSTCNGKPIDSRLRIRLNFSTQSTEV